jgi:hypothetical protein
LFDVLWNVLWQTLKCQHYTYEHFELIIHSLGMKSALETLVVLLDIIATTASLQVYNAHVFNPYSDHCFDVSIYQSKI